MGRSSNPISFNTSDKNHNPHLAANEMSNLIQKLNPTSPTANDNKFNFDKVNLVALNSNEYTNLSDTNEKTISSLVSTVNLISYQSALQPYNSRNSDDKQNLKNSDFKDRLNDASPRFLDKQNKLTSRSNNNEATANLSHML